MGAAQPLLVSFLLFLSLLAEKHIDQNFIKNTIYVLYSLEDINKIYNVLFEPYESYIWSVI